MTCTQAAEYEEIIEKLKNPWKDAHKEKPKREGCYLVERMDRDSGDTWFEVSWFENQDEYEEKFSKEFNQKVRVLVKAKEMDFDNRYNFVLRWMEIPRRNLRG